MNNIPVDIWQQIAIHANEFTAIIRTCKRLHWLAPSYLSPTHVAYTVGRQRLRNKHYKGFNPNLTLVRGLLGEAIWNFRNVPDYHPTSIIYHRKKHFRLIYRAKCVNSGYKKHSSSLYSRGLIDVCVFGSIDCCAGDLTKCSSGAALLKWLTDDQFMKLR